MTDDDGEAGRAGLAGRPAVSRREFVRVASATVVCVATNGLVACTDGAPSAPTAPAATGRLEGTVLNVQGVPQAGFGTLILMYPTGHHAGPTVGPDANGRFSFPNLSPGSYQLRFEAANQAIVPEPYQHPIRFTVEAGRTTQLEVRIQRGSFAQNFVEIYCGDDFFQLQPNGPENGETLVPLGTVVCWYNVGLKVHTVTGGPWVDSGDLQKSQAYIWVADAPGLHAYRCRHSEPHMRATLRVLPESAVR